MKIDSLDNDSVSIDTNKNNIMEFIHIYKDGKSIGFVSIFNSSDGTTTVDYSSSKQKEV